MRLNFNLSVTVFSVKRKLCFCRDKLQHIHLIRINFLLTYDIYVVAGHCPSADDPRSSVNETDCYNVTASGGNGVGKYGNLCQVDCSNRGICDYNTGECQCFENFYGPACAMVNAHAIGSVISNDDATISSSNYHDLLLEEKSE